MFLLKESYYNLQYNINNCPYVINTANCALAKVNEHFVRIAQHPNEDAISNDKELSLLRDNMCKAGFLVPSSVDEVEVLRYTHLKCKYSKEQLTLTISPTMNCNFDCIYCFEKKENQCMSTEVLDGVIRFAEKKLSGCKKLNVVWFGGEPLLAMKQIGYLSTRLLNLAEKYHSEYSAMMISNGYLFNEDMVRQLLMYKIGAVQVTMDGPKEVHSKRRFLKRKLGIDTYEKILENIVILKRNNVNVKLRINIDKENVTYIESFIEDLYRRKIVDISVSIGQVLNLTDECKDIKNVCLSTEEYGVWVNKLYRILYRNGFKVLKKYPFYPVPKSNYCGAEQINSFIIQPNGNIYKCWDSLSQREIGNVKSSEKNVEHNFNEAEWMLNDPFSDKECSLCKMLPVCMGGCPHLRKRFKKHFCEMWKSNMRNVVENIVLNS